MSKVNDVLRSKYVDVIKACLANLEEEVLVTGSNEIALPVVDSEGNDNWVVITVKVPTGSRDGEKYDGYSMQQDFLLKQENKKLKEKIAAEKKAKKIAADEKKRAAQQ